CYHLYPIRIAGPGLDRGRFIEELKNARIGASVHFIPLHRQPYYRESLSLRPESFPMAERFYEGLVSLPLYPKMTDEDLNDVVEAVTKIVAASRSSES